MRTDAEILKDAAELDYLWTGPADRTQDTLIEGFKLIVEVLLDIRAAVVPKPITILFPGLKEERDAARKTP